MKALMIFTLALVTSAAQASDALKYEVICNKVLAAGDADNGMTLILQSNETAWMKNVAVYRDGWAGPTLLANIQVPLIPQIEYGSGVPIEIHTYRGEGLTLELMVLGSEARLMPGSSAKLSLPEMEEEIIALECEYAQ